MVSSYPASDASILATFLPNRGRTKFVRAVIMLFLAAGTLGCIATTGRTFSEFLARRSWPVAQGHVTDVRVRSYTGPSSKDHVPHYFVEYEVRFIVPAEQCLTGTTFVIEGEPPLCEGIARTHGRQIPNDSQTVGLSAIVSIPLWEFYMIRMGLASRSWANQLTWCMHGRKFI